METIEEFAEESGYFIPQDEFKQKLVSVFAKSFDTLFALWSEIGITGDLLRDRQVTLINHHKILQRQMIDEETKTRDKLRENLTNLKDELEVLCIQLKIDSTIVPTNEHSATLLEQESQFKDLVKDLLELKDLRVEEFQSLLKQEQELCGTMELHQKYSSLFAHDGIPSEEVLIDLKQWIKDLQKEKKKRFSVVSKLRKQIKMMMTKLEKDLTTCDTLQCQLLKYPDEVILSENNLRLLENWKSELDQEERMNKNEIEKLLKRLESFWELLEVEKPDRELVSSQYSACSANSIAGLKRVINELDIQRRASLSKCFAKAFDQLTQWWNKCKVAENDRVKIANLTEDEYTEETLSSLQDEINQLKKYYDKNVVLFSRIDKWFSLWDKLLVFENKSNDKTRYHNRGGNLLKEEKERRQLDKQLPKLEAEISSLISDWELKNNKTFLIFGMEAIEYFEKQKMDLQMEKENLKMQRQLKRNEDDKTILPLAHTPSKRFCTPNIMGNTCTPKRNKLTPGNYMSRLTCPSSLHPKSPASTTKNLQLKRKSARLMTRQLTHTVETPVSSKTSKVINMGEYSVCYKPEERKKANASVASDSPSTSATNKNRVIKVNGSKVIKRYSNEGQRHRSLRSSTKNSISILQKGAQKLARHISDANRPTLTMPIDAKLLKF